MPDPDPLDSLRDALGATPAPEARTPDCLDDDTIAALAAGAVDAAARARALAHVAACARCRHAVASVARALTDPAVAREVAAAERRGRRLPYRLALSAAAAAILLLLAGPRLLELGRPVHRAPPVTGTVPVPASPVGVVATRTRCAGSPCRAPTATASRCLTPPATCSMRPSSPVL